MGLCQIWMIQCGVRNMGFTQPSAQVLKCLWCILGGFSLALGVVFGVAVSLGSSWSLFVFAVVLTMLCKWESYWRGMKLSHLRVLPVGWLDFGSVGVVPRKYGKQHPKFCPCPLFKVLGAFCILSMCRIGEAANPGPSSDSWSIGVFNPSGLNSKIDMVSHMSGEIWLGSETHLSQVGFGKFRAGLRGLKSPFTSVVQGSPCAPRSSSGVGNFSGVIILSQFPARPLPNSFCPEQFATGRIQVAGACVHGLWIQMGVLYGYPDSVQHRSRTFHTDCLLDQLVTRIGCEASGPRVIGGDFNHGPNGLSQIARLQDLGFREAQAVALARWGSPVVPTGRGSENIDQLWLSPEMQSLLIGVSVDDTHWATHSTVVASFQAHVAPLRHFHWFQPSAFPWPETWEPVVAEWNLDLSVQYAQFWTSQETAAADRLGEAIPEQCFGRGCTLETQTQLANWAPVPMGRQGDLQPKYFGTSKKHYLRFRQLRRLQSLCRMMNSESLSPMHQVKKCELWSAIRHASGFGDSFESWCSLLPDFPTCVGGFPQQLPDSDFISCLFEKFQVYMDRFEAKLGANRYQQAKERRSQDVRYVFRDLAREAPEKVDSLVFTRELKVEHVCPDDSSIVLCEPVHFLPDTPVVFQGKSVQVIIADHDQVWSDSVDNLAPGSILRQEKVVTSDEAILHEFRQIWEQRWNKASHVVDSQWEQITGFIAQHFRPLSWSFSQWSGDKVFRLAKQKKPTSATSSDGVSRLDVISMPPLALQSLAAMFQTIEATAEWPCQLLQGMVTGLSKGKGEGVDAFRPVTIFPFLTRLWSTGRAREVMQCILPSLPESVRGAVPCLQAEGVWFEIAQLIEHSYIAGSPLHGILVDVQRAFNALPRDPIWTLLITLDAPKWLVKTRSAFLAGQNRRFRVRASVGEPIFSSVGFPEGCALSVIGVTLMDWVLDRWLASMVCDPHSLVTYVDDWHVLYPSVESFGSLWQALQAFAEVTDLTIDDNKSLLWASHQTSRKELRNQGQAVSLAARDLGAHQNFCLKSGNRTLLNRLEQMPMVWLKLRACLSPYKLKVLGLRQLAWTRAFYGISVVHLGHSRIVKLRTGACRGLRVDRVGSNPALHLTTNGFQVDPEAFVITQTLREVREVGNLDWMRTAWQLLWIDPDAVPANGPCRVLVTRLSRLGWHLSPDGRCRDLLGSFCPLVLPWNDLILRLELAWPQALSVEVAHRSSFQGIASASLFELRLALRRFGAADLVFLRCSLDGTMYHEVGKDKENRGGHSVCQHCGEVDSVFHYLWRCPATLPCRRNFPWPQLVDSLPSCLSCHGWPVLSDAWLELQRWFLSVVEPAFPVVKVGPEVEVIDIFTDGACAFPDCPGTRFAAWAVTQAVGPIGSLSHVELDSGWVWGLRQTAYRGELIAMWRALVHCASGNFQARIWCDNLTVVRRVRMLLAGGTIKPNASHSDVLSRISQVISQHSLASRVRIAKVTSHCSVGMANCEAEGWIFWHNQQVDEVATRTNLSRPSFLEFVGGSCGRSQFPSGASF